MEGLQVGRIVHYVAYGTPGGEYQAGAHRAAIVTEVLDDQGGVSLCIFNPTGMHFNRAGYSEEPKPGTWHWPERS
jgi:hypothetical protein